MVLQATTRDREHDKFFADDDGNTSIRTSAKGTFKLTGLTTGGLMTEVTANDSAWVALPGTALTSRNTLAIQNQGTVDCKINYSNAVGYVGKILGAGDEVFVDITDAIIVYGRSSSGNVTLLVEEIA